ncbi:MAG: asparagine synthase [Thermococci archaeon]|nr:asparagine synthase [Thermococci archaeon]
MCLVAGGISNGGDVRSALIRMIETGKHRGPDAFGVWVDGRVMYSNDFGDVHTVPSGEIGMVHCRLSVTGSHPQPLVGRFPLIHNGEIYNHEVVREWLERRGFRFSTDVDSEVILHLLEYALDGNSVEDAVRFVMRSLNGDYAVAFVMAGSVYLFRDPLGVRPLYYSRSGYFASERKVLWAIGQEAIPVMPGELVVLRRGAVLKRRLMSPLDLGGRPFGSEDRVISSIEWSLRNSVRLRSVPKLGVLFSGGLDSSIVATLAAAHSDVTLYVSGTEGSHDVVTAERVSEELGLRLRESTFTCEDVEEALSSVMFAVEEPNAMNLSIGIPMHFATAAARRDGIRILLSGQGADELFGGYMKYVQDPSLMLRDVEDLGERNLARDDKIGMASGVECRFPFLDPGVVGVALRTPTRFKIDGIQRKVALRKAAERMGLPRDVWESNKKAAQYGSGSQKCLERIAKENGVSLSQLARRLFEETFGSASSLSL